MKVRLSVFGIGKQIEELCQSLGIITSSFRHERYEEIQVFMIDEDDINLLRLTYSKKIYEGKYPETGFYIGI